MRTLVAILILAFTLGEPVDASEPRVLLFSKTADFRHTSIEPGISAIRKLGGENGFDVDATEDSSVFTREKLKRYAAVIFLSTTKDVLDPNQQTAFQQYIRGGGGFVGIHAATDTEYDWPWYGKLVGARFDNHGEIQQASVLPVATFGSAPLPNPWVRRDEWYNFKQVSPAINVILKLDTKTFEGSKHSGNHPIAWYHEFEGGRVFYTGLGHTDESYSEPLFIAHVLDGIRYAIGQTAPAVSERE